ncbi:MAG: acylphosphatase [Gudongella sp.]|jgi:acylphosphatase|nr:acylphosphatase [Gudongella sp.]
MHLKKMLKRFRDNYIIRQVENIKFPEFPDEVPIRVRADFYGKVQNVGFRYEVYLLARRLELTGWVENASTGEVMAEFQGSRQKILFLIDFMKSLIRARVDKVETLEIDVITSEDRFLIIK